MAAIPALFIFAARSVAIGGDALRGFADEGRYFVSNRGTFTEVSRMTYYVSRFLGFAMFACFASFMIVQFWIRVSKRNQD
ncbi:MAG: hypothetical protein AAFQ64_06525 [Pseudomonadota bacterium]